MNARDQRFQEVVHLLRRQIINTFTPGERLPSKRELASMHGVGPRTIERALKVLTEHGLVKVVPRVGSVRAADEKASTKPTREKLTVGIMSRHSADEWPSIEIYQMLLAEAKQRDISVVAIPNPHSYRQPPTRNRIKLENVPWNTFDVGLLVEAEDTIRLRDPLLLSRKVLAVDQDATAYGIDSVAFADMQAGAMVARHLLDLGHMRFAVTEDLNDPGIPADPAFLARRYGFEAAVGEAGGQILPQWRMPIPRRGYKGFLHHFVKTVIAGWTDLPPGQRPTAIFGILQTPFVDGSIFEELARHGLQVPRDFSVVVATWGGQFYGGPKPVYKSKRLTCIDFDLSALVRRVYDAAAELAQEKTHPSPNRQPKLFLAPAKLIAGESSAPAPRF